MSSENFYQAISLGRYDCGWKFSKIVILSGFGWFQASGTITMHEGRMKKKKKFREPPG